MTDPIEIVEGDIEDASNHAEEDVDVLAQVAGGEHDRVFTYPLSLGPLSPSRFYLSIQISYPFPDGTTDTLPPVGNIHKGGFRI